jgi:hypothetical protein
VQAPISDDGISLDDPAAAEAAAKPPRFDAWQTTHQVRQLGRELRRSTIASPAVTSPLLNIGRRLDPPQHVASDLTFDTAPATGPIFPHAPAHTTLNFRRSRSGQLFAWLVVFAGLGVLIGGLGLITWSLVNEHFVYWNAAIGLTLGGQGTLIFGLVLVVTHLWRSSRYASSKLNEVHARLGQVQQTADVLATMRSGGAPAFYTDLVRGSSPQVLLANLKGQLDQLTARIGK